MTLILLSPEGLIIQVCRALGALEVRLQAANARAFFLDLGVAFPESISQNAALSSALALAASKAGEANASSDDLEATATAGSTEEVLAGFAVAVAALGDGLQALAGVADTLSTEKNNLGVPASVVESLVGDFASRVLSLVVIERAEEAFFSLTKLIGLLGGIDYETGHASGDVAVEAPSFTRKDLNLGALISLLSDPRAEILGRFGFGGAGFGDPSASANVSGLAFLQRMSQYLLDTGHVPYFEVREGALPFLRSLGYSFAVEPAAPAPLHLRVDAEVPELVGFSDELRPGWTLEATVTGAWQPGAIVTIDPPFEVSIEQQGGTPLETRLSFIIRGADPSGDPWRLLGQTGSSVLQVDGVELRAELDASEGATSPSVSLQTHGGKAIIDFSQGDGFLTSLTASSRVEAAFDVGATFSFADGLAFEGGRFEVILPLNASFGGLRVNRLKLQLPLGAPGRDGLPIDFAVDVGAGFGPFDAIIEGIGLRTDLTFDGGNLGFGNIEVGFRFPTGVGLALDIGTIRGGGFLSLDEAAGRYFGAVELSVFGVAVKAFGLIETVLPDGSKGSSFVIVISAEFTPIQLGFGFTLLGVGGLLGVHRTVNVDALGTAARTGSLAHLLFPRNVVQDAPAIVHDLATVFPAARDHYIFGPMAKFGWGTPTLITGSFGVLIEFPGPRIGLIGVVSMQLPDPSAAILSLQMAIQGFLDFPAKLLTVDAGLFDSFVAGFAVAGDMAYRLGFGNNAKFLMSIGGFNPDFDAPAEFPVLRRASVELGVTGNPSLTASGYFALTSNTAQIGARIDLRASGFGIRLTGWLGFDALFVFSPFSFTASFSAGMRVSFHGAGIGVTLHGTLKGTNPWKISGKVCVSVLFWDACLSVDHTFGNREAAALPEIDPWEGLQSDDPRLQVVGMRAAVSDARNWSGTNPPAGFSVVTLSEATTVGRTPIDPLGAATLRQRVAPLGEVLTKFGEYKPIINNEFTVESVKFDEQEVTSRVDVEDDFAPAHFFELSNAERLSTESYQKMRAGFTIDPERTTVGSADSTTVDYETDFITVDGNFMHDDVVYRPSQALISGLLKNLAKLKGVRQTGARKFITPNKAKKVTFGPARYVVVDSCTSVPNTGILGTETTQIAALLALRKHVGANPTDFNRYQVAPKFAVPT